MTAHTCSSITCKNPACVRRRIENLLADRFHGPFYTKERAIELVAIEWYSDKARILELMAESETLQEELKESSKYIKRLQDRIDFLERQPRDSFRTENTAVTVK